AQPAGTRAGWATCPTLGEALDGPRSLRFWHDPRADQNPRFGITWPSAIRDRQVTDGISMVWLMKWTDPSAKTKLTPPGCELAALYQLARCPRVLFGGGLLL